MMIDADFINRIDKEREYKAYLNFHISHVEEAFHRLMESLRGTISDEFDDALDQCLVHLPLHDLSKLSKEEFDSYRIHFYPTDLEKKNKIEKKGEFDLAWEHHHQLNPHHPIHWCVDGVNQPMPLCYIIEMICDWDSVSQWYDSSILDFYDHRAKEERSYFTPKTQEWVDLLMDRLFRETKLKF